MRQLGEATKNVNNNNVELIPILMFNIDLNTYWIEHIWIINIDTNISIGVSFKYQPSTMSVTVSGIHLDKDYLQIQHELVLPDHDCHCFDGFNSHISDLKIGNPDDLQVNGTNICFIFPSVFDILSIEIH